MDLRMTATHRNRHVSRRLFLAASLSTAACTTTLATREANAAAPEQAVDLTRQLHPQVRVRIEIDVEGNVNVTDNPLASKKTERKFPIESKAVLDYEERPLRPEHADPQSEVVAAERYYHEASSTSTLNKTASRRELRQPMRHVIVRREQLPETVYSPEQFFTHDELSLLKSPVSSVSVDRLLPDAAVVEGDRFEVDSETLCSVLNLSSVDSGRVEGTVTEVGDDSVRFKLEGEIQGSVEGVDTRLRLLGKLTFDRDAGICSWFALAVHETREIGKAEPGFDIAATIRMVRRPMKAPNALPATPAKIDFRKPIPAERLYVELQSRHVRVGTMMDRRWWMVQDRVGAAVMRMIDHNQSIAQCNLRSLVPLPDGKQLTLEAFRQGVQESLGGQLRQLVKGDQRVTAQGLRVLRVVADGETKGVPIRWIMMHFSDDEGHRVQATFTMSADEVETFAANDSQLADSLRFLSDEDLRGPESPDSAEPLAEVSDPATGGDTTQRSVAQRSVAQRPSRERSSDVPGEKPVSSSDLR
jgi:hypothetical protein